MIKTEDKKNKVALKSATSSSSLTSEKEKELSRLKKIILKGQKASLESGRAMRKIRDEKLYPATHGTWDNYCKQELDYVPQHANRLIKAAEIQEVLEPIGSKNDVEILSKESQLRELARLDSADERKSVYISIAKKAKEDGEKVRAWMLKEAVDKLLNKEDALPEKKAKKPVKKKAASEDTPEKRIRKAAELLHRLEDLVEFEGEALDILEELIDTLEGE